MQALKGTHDILPSEALYETYVLAMDTKRLEHLSLKQLNFFSAELGTRRMSYLKKCTHFLTEATDL